MTVLYTTGPGISQETPSPEFNTKKDAIVTSTKTTNLEIAPVALALLEEKLCEQTAAV